MGELLLPFDISQASVSRIEGNEVSPIDELAGTFMKDLVGQERACRQVARRMCLARDDSNVITGAKGALIFLGPTGVGKTELTKLMAKYLYGRDWEKHYIKINCTDLQERGSITRLKGADPSFTGYGDPTLIPSKKLRNGAVVVFDEVEKADPATWKWLMPAIEPGVVDVYEEVEEKSSYNAVNKIVRAEPIKLDFTDSFIVLTANEGSEEWQQSRGKVKTGFQVREERTIETREDFWITALKRGKFRRVPEFINRLSDIVVFSELSGLHFDAILDKYIAEANVRLMNKRKGLFYDVTPRMRQRILSKADISEYGARDIRRSWEKNFIAEVTAQKIMGKIPSDGFWYITGDYDERGAFLWKMPISQESMNQFRFGLN